MLAEQNALAGKGIHVRRLDFTVTGTAKGRAAPLVGGDQENIRLHFRPFVPGRDAAASRPEVPRRAGWP
jgi:hypothetical protein